MIAEFILLLVSLALTLLIVTLNGQPFKKRTFNGHHHLPPGPSGWQLLGLLPMIFQKPLETVQKHRHQFGPLFQFKVGPFLNLLVLCDPKTIRAAFRHPGFSDRIDPHFIREGTMGKGVTWSIGPCAAEQRRFLMHNLKNLTDEENSLETKLQLEAVALVQFLTGASKRDLVVTINDLFAPYILNSFWGYVIGGQRFEPDDPDFLRLVHLVTKKLNVMDSVPEFLSGIFPWMAKLFPSACNRKAEALKEIYDYMEICISKRKTTWLQGQPRDLTDRYLDKVAETTSIESSTFHEKHNFHPYITGDLFIGAVHTVSLTLEWLMNYLSTNPRVQDKIFQEIYQTVGTSRLPCLQDRSKCPYACAVVQEILRITALFPLGMPHQANQDVTFMGYHVAKGTVIVSAVHAIHHDPALWDEPEKFCPERFLPSSSDDAEDDEKADSQLKKKLENLIPFGFGRRSCIGGGMARDGLFLFLTIICQRFIISPPNPWVREVTTIVGVTLEPEFFQLRFIPREEFL